MNWLGRTKLPRRTRPAPPSSERLNDPQSSTSGRGAIAGTADNLSHAIDDGDGQRDPYSVYGDPDSPVNTTLEKIEKTEKNDKQDKADDCTSARSTGEDSVESCATNGDNVPQRVHFTDNPRRYMTNLSKSGWYYRYHSQYVSKNAKDRRVSAYYKCALARRKGFGTCPARVLISRTAGAAKFRVIVWDYMSGTDRIPAWRRWIRMTRSWIRWRHELRCTWKPSPTRERVRGIKYSTGCPHPVAELHNEHNCNSARERRIDCGRVQLWQCIVTFGDIRTG